MAGPREGDVGSRGGGSTCGYSTKLTQTGGGGETLPKLKQPFPNVASITGIMYAHTHT